jgi:Xaa-Pro aminopeptidase
MHRTSHWLGMDVHDCGDYRERTGAEQADGSPPWRKLAPGMVLTIEPGIYVNASDDLPERFHDVGIRIEDDVVITDGTPEVITSDVPKSVQEVQALTSA